MEDARIVDLYWQRDERALRETAVKYGPYCTSIANNILRSPQDAEECVNDTYTKAWNSMPTNRPQRLAPYLGKLTRWLALDRLDAHRAAKRGGDLPTALPLDEFDNQPSARVDVQSELEMKELCRAVNSFLTAMNKTERQVFVARYWYMAPVNDISLQFGFSQSKVKSMLMRTRNRLMDYLKEEELC